MGMVFSASTTVLADSTIPLIGGPTTATVRTTASEEAVAVPCLSRESCPRFFVAMLRLAQTLADSSPTALRLARSVALPRRSLCGRSTALHRILSCRPPPQSFAALLLLHGGTPAFAVQRRVAARQAARGPEAESASLSPDGRPG